MAANIIAVAAIAAAVIWAVRRLIRNKKSGCSSCGCSCGCGGSCCEGKHTDAAGREA